MGTLVPADDLPPASRLVPEDDLPEAPKPAPKAAPGFLSRAMKALGEIGASAATGAESLGQVLDPVVAAAGAAGSYLVPHTAPEGATLGERFQNEMEGLRRTREERLRASPNAYGAGAILEGGALAPVLAQAAPFSAQAPTAATAAGTLGRTGAALADASLLSGASNAASNIDRSPLQSFAEGATSPANLIAPGIVGAGELVPALASAARPGFTRLLTSALPKVQPTEAAKLLRKEGVPLTLGQNDPDSFYAALEQASADHPLGMHIEQGQARDAFGHMVVNKAQPPGAEPLTAGTTQERLAATRQAFNDAYAPLKANAVSPETLTGMPETALKPKLGVPNSVRAKAAESIRDALSSLQDETGAIRPDVTVGDLIKVRSDMRKDRTAAVAKGDNDLAKALKHGLDTLTGAIESNLPSAEDKGLLRSVDGQYRKFMTVEDAAAKGGPDSDITARHLAGVLPRSEGKRAVVEGRAGELQDLAQAGAETFDQRVKPTGMRGPILHLIPKPGVVSRVLNQPSIKAGILGEEPPPAPPSPYRPLLIDPRALAAPQAVRPRVRGGLRLGTATADDDQR